MKESVLWLITNYKLPTDVHTIQQRDSFLQRRQPKPQKRSSQIDVCSLPYPTESVIIGKGLLGLTHTKRDPEIFLFLVSPESRMTS